LFVALTALLVLGSACGNTNADREKRIAVERTAIEGYSAKIPEAIRYQAAFADEWRQVNEIKDLKSYTEAMRSRVIPALEKYVAALRMMPTNSKKLADIHTKVTAAYEAAVSGFSSFQDGLTDENVEERYQSLLKAMETVAHAEKTYQRHLETYYASNRVTLDTPKTAPSAAPKTPAAQAPATP
jgi:hypothetical protein